MQLTSYNNNNYFLQGYLKAWLIFFFITSVVAIPAIEGTTPGYLLSFLSLPLVFLFSKHLSVNYLLAFLLTLTIVFSFAFFSQINLLIYENSLPSPEEITLIGKSENFLLRRSFFTQHLYLAAALLAFIFVLVFYNPVKHDKYLFAGVWILIVYGFYELTFFLITGEYGDFMSNRMFSEGSSGSLKQSINIAGFRLQRFKSLTGEPSMYAFTVFPACIYAYHTQRKKTALIIFISLVLTFSTTFILGVVLYLTCRFLKRGFKDKIIFYFTFLGLAGVIAFYPVIAEVFQNLVVNKLNGANFSGMDRIRNFENHLAYYQNLPFPLKLSGVGFGYVRSTDFFSTLLVNVGAAGLLLYVFLFALPLVLLKKSERNVSIKYFLLFLLLSSLIAVPEFAYLSLWLFLGIAYNQMLREYKIKLNARNLY